MAIHISATTGCNLGCTYCYEDTDRERSEEWANSDYDMDKIMATLEDWREKYPNTTPGMHGGEPLLVKNEDLRTIFAYIEEHWDGKTHIQTNGTLIDEETVEIFKEFNVGVGLSCDGPPELNRERKAAGERKTSQSEATDKMSERTHEAMEMMIEAGVKFGTITVLHKTNAGTEEKFERLLDWMDWLCQNDCSGHFNPAIPYADVQEDISLGPEVLKDRYLRAWEWMKEEPYRKWGPMESYVDNLLGNQVSNCVNNKCDVFNAGAAKIIKGNGESTGCGKTWGQVGDGVPFLQGPSSDEEYDNNDSRYEMLKQTPGWVTEGEPDLGGCKGCEYWNVCQGGCPSAGENDDFRNRTYFCRAKYALYDQVEHDIRAVLPNVRLITDLPWNAQVADHASNWNLDIKPFASARPDTEGKSAAFGYSKHQFGTPSEESPDGTVPNLSWEDRKEELRGKYDEEVLSFDDENNRAHADSELREEKPDDDNGWKQPDSA